MTRKKIPEKVQADVLFKSNRECVVCEKPKRGNHIHHIDGDNSNNKFENLAFLCFDCHDDASLTGSLSKKLTPKTIIQFRDLKYQVIANRRKESLKTFDTQIVSISEEDLLTASKNAWLVLEIDRVKEKFGASTWSKRSKILDRLNVYSRHSNLRLAKELFELLSYVADHTRNGMTKDVASSIFFLILAFFSRSFLREKVKAAELSLDCVNIAFSLTYDSFVHSGNYNVAMYGLSILKFIYKISIEENFNEMRQQVIDVYSEIEGTLERPDIEEKSVAKELTQAFKSDLDNKSLAFPPISKKLMSKIQAT